MALEREGNSHSLARLFKNLLKVSISSVRKIIESPSVVKEYFGEEHHSQQMEQIKQIRIVDVHGPIRASA